MLFERGTDAGREEGGENRSSLTGNWKIRQEAGIFRQDRQGKKRKGEGSINQGREYYPGTYPGKTEESPRRSPQRRKVHKFCDREIREKKREGGDVTGGCHTNGVGVNPCAHTQNLFGWGKSITRKGNWVDGEINLRGEGWAGAR